MESKRSEWGQSYRDFACGFGTAWLIVIVLAIVTGGQIGRWGGFILPTQFFGSLAYAVMRTRRRRLNLCRREPATDESARFVPI